LKKADILPMICKSRKCSSIVAKERLKQLCDSTGDLVSCFRDVQGGNNYSVDVNRTMQLIRTKEAKCAELYFCPMLSCFVDRLRRSLENGLEFLRAGYLDFCF
jgi:hypothetical protein